MGLLISFALLIAGFVALAKGSDWFVDGAVGIAMRFGIPQLVIGLTIVAMGTSAPEAAVSITAALKGSADITIGNVVGSNILNILIILGISAVIAPLTVKDSTAKVEMPFMIGVTFLLLILGLSGAIYFWGGVILWVLFVLFLLYLLKMSKKDPDAIDVPDQKSADTPLPKSILLAIIGLALIILGSDIAVDGATGIARAFGLSERLIGLTIIALGTSLPELFTSVTAARKGNCDIAIGNIVGSNLFNILFVTGTTALITTVPFAASFRVDMAFAIGASVLLWLFTFRSKKLGRPAGIVLLLCYAAYFAVLLLK